MGGRREWRNDRHGVCRRIQVEGLNVQGNSRGGVGIQIDKNGAGAIWNTTDGRLVNNTFQGANQNWIGVSISPVSKENVEDMRIEVAILLQCSSRHYVGRGN